MKIDSIFSTFDKKIEREALYLSDGHALLGNNLEIVKHAYRSYIRLLIDIHDSEDPTFLWGVASAFYNCVKNVPLLEMQECFNFIHEQIVISAVGIVWQDRFKDDLFRKFGYSKCNSGRLIWPFLVNVIKKVYQGDELALVNLATLCKFFSKMSLDLPELEDDCIASYLKSEDRLRGAKAPSRFLS